MSLTVVVQLWPMWRRNIQIQNHTRSFQADNIYQRLKMFFLFYGGFYAAWFNRSWNWWAISTGVFSNIRKLKKKNVNGLHSRQYTIEHPLQAPCIAHACVNDKIRKSEIYFRYTIHNSHKYKIRLESNRVSSFSFLFIRQLNLRDDK